MGDEATRYLLRVITHYRQAIEAGHLDEVIEEVELSLWRLDPRVIDIPLDTLSAVEEMFRSVHDRVVAGAYAQALSHLEGLRERLLKAETDQRSTA